MIIVYGWIAVNGAKRQYHAIFMAAPENIELYDREPER